jgi:bacillithiol system protein YtxJ
LFVVAKVGGGGAVARELEASIPAATTATTPEGYEPGNLSEVGAHEILTKSEYDRAVTLSKTKPMLLFKHSTQCEHSGAAYRRLAAWLRAKGGAAPVVYLVKVIEQKPVSQYIAEKSGITHESPQAIVFSDGKPVWNADHEAITGDAIDAALKALPSAKS